MEGPKDYHTKQSKSERQRQIPYDIIYMRKLKYDTNAFVYEMNKITDTENREVAAKGERAGGGMEREAGLADIRCHI